MPSHELSDRDRRDLLFAYRARVDGLWVELAATKATRVEPDRFESLRSIAAESESLEEQLVELIGEVDG